MAITYDEKTGLINEEPRYFFAGDRKMCSKHARFVFLDWMRDELEKCSESLEYWSDHYYYINSQEKGVHLCKWRDYQRRFLRKFLDHRFFITCASRQSGKTTFMSALALHTLCFKKDQTIMILANKQQTSNMILERIKDSFKEIPLWAKPTVVKWAVTEAKLANGNRIIARPTSDGTRGESVNLLLVDEFAHIEPKLQRTFWTATSPTLAADHEGLNTKMVIVSTPNGTNDLFYDFFSKAEAGENGWGWDRVDWRDVPGRDEAWRLRELANLNGDERLFRQEYENDFTSGSTGVGIIDNEVLMELRDGAMREPLEEFGDVVENLSVFERPMQGHNYVVGVDVSEGVGQNYSVAQVLDVTDITDIRQSAIYSSNTTGPNEFSADILKIARMYNMPWLAVERNRDGAVVLNNLIENYRYPKIVDWHPKGHRKDSYSTRGIYSQGNSKRLAVINLRYYVNNVRQVRLHDYATISELEIFKKHENGRWKKEVGNNRHDDRVDALMWALSVLHDQVAPQCFEVMSRDSMQKISNVEDLQPMTWGEVESGEFGGPMNDLFGISRDEIQQRANFSRSESEGWVLAGG